ncbi:MAG: hypothetical protein Q9177_002043 [Variospora cf. flavescens]
MYISVLAALAAVSLSLVKAQSVSLGDLPKCAQSAAAAGLRSTPCDFTDFPCICSSGPFVSALTTSVQAACSVADQQSNSYHTFQFWPGDSSLTSYVLATLKFAQGFCGPFGVMIDVPAIAGANSAAPPSAAQAVSSPQTEAAAAATTPTAADDTMDEASEDETMTSAPVSSGAFLSSSSSSNPSAADPTSGPTSMASDAGDAGADAASAATATSTISSLIVYDTKSIIPSATVAILSTDAAATNEQMASSTGSSYSSNSTANSTVAASSPIPYMGAAVRGNVQVISMVLMGTLGVFFCWL